MTRLRLPDVDYADPDLVFFVTIRAHPGLAPFTDPHLACGVIASLHWLREHRGVCLYAYCLMPDHLHLLLQLGNAELPLGTIIGSMKSFTTKQYWKAGHRGMLWQERFHDRAVRKSEDGRTMAAYILDNPVRKGLVADATDYPWSGMPDPLE